GRWRHDRANKRGVHRDTHPDAKGRRLHRHAERSTPRRSERRIRRRKVWGEVRREGVAPLRIETVGNLIAMLKKFLRAGSSAGFARAILGGATEKRAVRRATTATTVGRGA